MQRGGKRKVCTYFSSNGYCFYGDQCQFVHARPGPVTPNQIPQGRSTSPAHMALSRTEPSKEQSNPYQSHGYSQHSLSYVQPRNQLAPNPPKHRGTLLGGSGSSRQPSGHMMQPSQIQPHPHLQSQQQRLVHQQPMKAYPDAAGPGMISSLNPPPFSKQTKIRATNKMTAQAQVESGGTTYFYSPDQQPSYTPGYSMYTKPLTHVAHSTQSPSFFTPETLRQELLARESVCLSMPVSNDTCPSDVEHYNSLCPLEPVDTTPPDQKSKQSFGHPSTCYRCVSSKDGLYYCLRRIHGFRLSSGKAVLELLENWRKLHHVNLVALREMFTTKAFGDNSVVFVYDYHPGAENIQARYLTNLKRTSLLSEDLVWEYVIQLVSALRLVHSNNLAMRCIEPSKILLSSQYRLRLSCAGIMDIVNFDVTASLRTALLQQKDLISMGEVILCVALQSSMAAKPENFHSSMEVLASSYSPDLHHIVQYLLQSGPKGPPHSIIDVLPMVGGRVYSSLEHSQLQQDYLEGELSKELQNGRLFRLLAKLGTINERPEFAGDPQWSETGDRYLLKLFRDYLFHQVLSSGKPWVDLAHIVQTLNKLDAGVPENMVLHSGDEKSVLIVSYAELKTCMETTFSEVLSKSTHSLVGGTSS